MASSPIVNSRSLRSLTPDVCSPAQLLALEQRLRAELPWRASIDRVLLFLGAALCLAGIIFFFAANWNTMPPVAKFALTQGALALAAISAWWVGLDRLNGKVLLLTASMLVGVFLAVFGQIFQTGADAYDLFIGWALLALPWVLLGRFGALWIVWLSIVNTAVVMYWQQTRAPDLGMLSTFADMAAVLAIVNGIALAGGEIGVRRGVDWLARDWLRVVLCFAVFAWLTLSGCVAVFDHKGGNAVLPFASVIVMTGVGFWIYRYVIPSLLCLAFGGASLCIVLLTLIGRGLFEGRNDFVGVFLLMGMIILGLFGALVFWLRRVAREIGET